MRRWSVMVRAARGWAAAVLLTVLAACTAAADAPRTSTGTPSARDAPVVATPSATAVPVPVRGVVVLDPGHNGGNADAPEEIARPVPAGGFTKPCNTTGTATSD